MGSETTVGLGGTSSGALDDGSTGPLDDGATGTVSDDSTGSAGEGSSSSSGRQDQVFLDDDFSPGLQGWIYQGSNGYSQSHDLGEGVPHPALRISGDCPASCDAGSTKAVDISGWQTSALILSLNFRAISTTPTSTVTNARVAIYDGDTNEHLLSIALVAGGVSDSGWMHHDLNIANEVSTANAKSLRIWLYTRDAWNNNYQQVAMFDNISLVGL
jgi:hypothetical protein